MSHTIYVCTCKIIDNSGIATVYVISLASFICGLYGLHVDVYI